MDFEFWKILITIVLAVIGWIVTFYVAFCGWKSAHKLTSERDVKNKKREIVLNYLIEAYFILTNDLTERGNINTKQAEKIEKIISQVQLFGSTKQVDLAKDIADCIGNGGIIEYDSLINSLRDDLRKELELEKIEGNVHWARFNFQ